MEPMKVNSFTVKNYMIAWTIVTGLIISAWFSLILLNSPCDNPTL